MLLFGIYSFFGFEFLRGTAEKIPTITFLNSLEILIRLGHISNMCRNIYFNYKIIIEPEIYFCIEINKKNNEIENVRRRKRVQNKLLSVPRFIY